MTFTGIVACQIGTAVAARTERASLRSVGFFTNRLLLWAIVMEITFAALLVYVPPLQRVFGPAALGVTEIAFLLPFPLIIWGADEHRRWLQRRRAIPPSNGR
jgi:magnesium-transporting ATPase (P-type)